MLTYYCRSNYRMKYKGNSKLLSDFEFKLNNIYICIKNKNNNGFDLQNIILCSLAINYDFYIECGANIAEYSLYKDLIETKIEKAPITQIKCEFSLIFVMNIVYLYYSVFIIHYNIIR